MAKNPTPMPPELDRWNWGAFFLTWIWSAGNAVWIGLIALIPLVNVVMMFVLAARGSRWAWEARAWSSPEDFRSTQRVWAWVGAGLWGAFIVLGMVGMVAVMAMLKGEPYDIAMAELRANPAVIQTFGQPLESGWLVSGSVSVEGATGQANLSIPLSGPRAEGTAVAEAEKVVGEWELRYLAIRPEGGAAEVLLDRR